MHRSEAEKSTRENLKRHKPIWKHRNRITRIGHQPIDLAVESVALLEHLLLNQMRLFCRIAAPGAS